MPWLPNLNPIPSFSEYRGPHGVGTLDVELSVTDLEFESDARPDPSIGTIAFRVFYPCCPPTSSTRPVRWIQKPQHKIVSAYARFLGAGSVLSDVFAYFPQLLYYVNIPASRNAALLESSNQSGRWPVLVFSHGLGGSRNSYSHICGSLSSYGLVVFAPDHRDGSSPVQYVRATETTAAKTVDYRVYSHRPEKETFDGRDMQLQIRLWELALLHRAMLKIDAGELLQNLDSNRDRHRKVDSPKGVDILSILRSKLDIHNPGAITWAGHSFGATTTVQFLKANFYSFHSAVRTSLLQYTEPASSLANQITPSSPTILLDPWALPLGSPNTKELAGLPMPCYQPTSTSDTVNLLAILSEAFHNWDTNFRGVKRFLTPPSSRSSSPSDSTTSDEQSTGQATLSPHIFYPEHSAHLSQSDFGTLFPRLSRYLAHALEPERTLDLNVRAMLETLRQAGVDVADTNAAVLDDDKTQSEVQVEQRADQVRPVEKEGEDEGFVLVKDSSQPPASSSAAETPIDLGQSMTKLVNATAKASGLDKKSNGRSDWRILSKQKGAVRGWIAVPLD